MYGELKEMGLSAQPAIHMARKVAGAYAALKANLKAGNYGPDGSRRRAKVESQPVRFRKDAAQPFDDRCLSRRLDALKDLGGIRERVRLRKPQRVTLHSWSFAQLGTYIAHRATRAGVPVVYVDPRHTSQGCSGCGHIDRKNRPDQITMHVVRLR